VANHPLTTQLLVNYQSDYYFDQNQNPYAMQDNYSIFNANIHYQHDNWAVAIWGKNLFGTQYSHLKFDLSSFLGMLEDFAYSGDGEHRFRFYREHLNSTHWVHDIFNLSVHDGQF